MVGANPARPALVWFRQDLRLADNPALAAAAASGRPIIPVFVLAVGDTTRPRGAASLWWLDKSLRKLAESLEAKGLRLVLRLGDPQVQLLSLAQEVGAGLVVWNRLYDPAAVERDTAIKRDLEEAGVEARSFNGALLNEPWTVRTGAGGPFKVFTAYWRAAKPMVAAEPAPVIPDELTGPRDWPAGDHLDDWRLHPTAPDWSTGFSDWAPGEAGALARLEDFLQHGLKGYSERRDPPARDGGSRLSPHLHWGEIGPRQVWRMALAHAASRPGLADDLDKFLSELGWREFNHQLLFNLPDLAKVNVRPEFDRFAWRGDPAALAAWRRGRTGYPLVDAGMRELWATGFMHNRVRMVVASFLVKHLLIDWRVGEAWFWDTLVDADLANNAANWQWTAGSGADAAPFFRIFNPVAQGERFDPEGAYVRRWVPELAGMPAGYIHAPWTAPAAVLAQAGMRLGRDYPHPIVEHAEARARALAAFQDLRTGD
ncbi:cryptochrome/photolyase family protein [Phenylobacterium montanum]|uniref:Deoxyribodipyrimidine photo-lyase n=1 Tax=Phenylobacterium montanum TaxID=2823693 RepID=A0A975G170_9CAUL|nr:deoxyribodipyrimidine photo-lyase [Caulobacter sp. S6]QUD88076.1 deoxyribodipyrimidine photo-lyase [Caulobacter sp. S6]